MKSCSRVFDDSHVTDVLLKNDERIPCASEALDSLWIPDSSLSFHASASSMVNFDQAQLEKKSSRAREPSDCKAENCDDEFDGCLHQPPEKKRRLTAEQVHFLEKSFAVENKLEPDRKIQLAKELGLQPRQVAIWFQNRRARSKTKVLEREYDSLKSCYDKLKADYDNLFSDNEKLKNEVHLLSQKLLVKENDGTSPKQEDTSSYSSHVVEADIQSDFEQDEDREFLLCLPKIEAEYYDDHLQPNSCNLGFPVQNQGTWFWQC